MSVPGTPHRKGRARSPQARAKPTTACRKPCPTPTRAPPDAISHAPTYARERAEYAGSWVQENPVAAGLIGVAAGAVAASVVAASRSRAPRSRAEATRKLYRQADGYSTAEELQRYATRRPSPYVPTAPVRRSSAYESTRTSAPPSAANPARSSASQAARRAPSTATGNGGQDHGDLRKLDRRQDDDIAEGWLDLVGGERCARIRFHGCREASDHEEVEQHQVECVEAVRVQIVLGEVFDRGPIVRHGVDQEQGGLQQAFAERSGYELHRVARQGRGQDAEVLTPGSRTGLPLRLPDGPKTPSRFGVDGVLRLGNEPCRGKQRSNTNGRRRPAWKRPRSRRRRAIRTRITARVRGPTGRARSPSAAGWRS